MIIKIINKNYIINIILIIIIIKKLFNCISKFKLIISNFKSENEFIKIENYLKICNNNKLKIIKKEKKSINPKISIISPIYNSEKCLLRFLNSIYYQNYKDIEIILIFLQLAEMQD